MKNVKSLLIFTLFLALIVYIFGCAPPSSKEEKVVLTPEQQQALEDSLREARLKELKIIRSFAYSHYNNKAWEEAAKYYAELAVKDTEHEFNDCGKWAQCLVQCNVSADSIKLVYQIGLDAFPNDAYLHASMGHILKTQGLLEEAVVHYEAAVENDPEVTDYMLVLAELYTRTGQPYEAIDLYSRILQKDPSNKNVAETLEHLVKQNLSLDDYIRSLEESIIHFPDDFGKKFDLAKAYIEAGQNDKARGMLDAIVAAQPDHDRAWEQKGNVLQNLRRYSDAISAYNNVLKTKPENTLVMAEISHCYRQLGQYEQSRTFTRKALAVDSKYGAAYMAQAAIYETAADKKTAGKAPSYTDKLVFLIAYGLYQDAKNTGDFRVLNDANTHLKYLKESNLIPAYADWFMHQTEKDPTKGGSYDWINTGWPEVKYIEAYLSQIGNK
ncbi:MAG: tetratricopeptide repeat protein [bacterium]